MYCTGGIRCEKASAYFKHKGFKNVFQLEGGIIEYTRQIKEEGLESKFIGKNFVFDQRLGERITEDIVSNCHQCGKPCDVHTNCANDGCHLLFIQCEDCKELLENCCSYECQEVTHLPMDQQIKLRQGLKNGNKIFKKGKAEALVFKNPSEAKILSKEKVISEIKPKIIKTYIGKAQHYFTKSSIGEFLIENEEIKIGDTLLIKGKTTGEEIFILESMYILKEEAEKAKTGDRVSFKLPFRIRLSDVLYRVEKL